MEAVGGTKPDRRGSGTITTILAGVLAHLFRDTPADGMVTGANMLGSDTDTICTMAGALIGAATPDNAPGDLADIGVIANEALRLRNISLGKPADVFHYPDLLTWRPPRSSLDAVVADGAGGLVLAGLGNLTPADGQPIDSNDGRGTVWQWMMLPFGQRVLVKRRGEPEVWAGAVPVGGFRRARHQQRQLFDAGADKLETSQPSPPTTEHAARPAAGPSERKDQIVEAAERAIEGNFRPGKLGQLLLELIDEVGVDAAVAFTAIVARERRGRPEPGDKS